MPSDLKTLRIRCLNQLEVIMDSAANYDLICPCCGEHNKGINLIETRGTMECIHCHVLVHITMQPDGTVEITGYDGEPYYPVDDEEDL